MIKIINYWLEFIKTEKQKKGEILKKQKTKVMIVKYYRTRGKISSLIKDNMNLLNKANNKY